MLVIEKGKVQVHIRLKLCELEEKRKEMKTS